MVDLRTNYLGISLKNPLVVAASPLSGSINQIKQMEEAGASAVVLFSLFEEQLEQQSKGTAVFPTPPRAQPGNTQPDFPQMEGYNLGVKGYLSHVYAAKKAVAIPIIGSLNGYYSSEWVQYAQLLEAAGADALELNIYYLPTNPRITSADLEKMCLELVASVKSGVKIPVAVKIGPYFSATAHMAQQIEKAGADGLVIFNRFYQPDIDLDTETVVSTLDLSHPQELRLRLRWAAILSSFLHIDLAITGGVHSGADVLKCLYAGAQTAMMASALLQNGIGHIQTTLTEMTTWLTNRGYTSVDDIRGKLSLIEAGDSAAFERANYMQVLAAQKHLFSHK
ncbi:MAG: dihydroorotate dehydrogenase-like protein [Anaerolineales bacterium]|nr:dihydroorotate dehydrogenase-like protein [Anaerolineales bacterium]